MHLIISVEHTGLGNVPSALGLDLTPAVLQRVRDTHQAILNGVLGPLDTFLHVAFLEVGVYVCQENTEDLAEQPGSVTVTEGPYLTAGPEALLTLNSGDRVTEAETGQDENLDEEDEDLDDDDSGHHTDLLTGHELRVGDTWLSLHASLDEDFGTAQVDLSAIYAGLGLANITAAAPEQL